MRHCWCVGIVIESAQYCSENSIAVRTVLQRERCCCENGVAVRGHRNRCRKGKHRLLSEAVGGGPQTRNLRRVGVNSSGSYAAVSGSQSSPVDAGQSRHDHGLPNHYVRRLLVARASLQFPDETRQRHHCS